MTATTHAIPHGAWVVWLSDAGSRATAAAWIRLVEDVARTRNPVHRSKHAATFRCTATDGVCYLKLYHPYGHLTWLKDAVRASKARTVLDVSRELMRLGFAVPRVVAAGEERRGPWLRRAWVATAGLAGEPIAERLASWAKRADGAAERSRLGAKRALLTQLGGEVGRLHVAGFIAGDLVPANVWVVPGPQRLAVAFADHDRTRQRRAPAAWWRARRNLVQLNRVVLAGITATDRLRVFRAYAQARGWTPAEARVRLDWIIRKTIARRRRFDGVRLAPGTRTSFRELMRADGPYAPGTADRASS